MSESELTVLRQNFFKLLVVRIQSGETLQIDDLLQGRVPEPETNTQTRTELAAMG